MKLRNKKAIFICQFTESSLEVIKCLPVQRSKVEVLGVESENITFGTDDKKLSGRLTQIFSKLQYLNNPIIVSLPRNSATRRYLKVPSQSPQEIEKILSLQISRYLPYTQEELISGYQIISSDKEGYSEVNLIIVHKDIIERYIRILKELKPAKITIALSSYGLCNFYHYIKPDESKTVMLIDINRDEVEVAIVQRRDLLFSRSFKINRLNPNLGSFFIDEINKSGNAYVKEMSREKPAKYIFVTTGRVPEELVNALSKEASLATEVLSYRDKINLSGDLLNNLLNSDSSFSSLIGLGLEKIPGNLNLLTPDIKEEAKEALKRKETSRLILFILITIFILSLGMAKNLDNKAQYLGVLKTELNKILNEAKPLEATEKRIRLLESYAQSKPSSLDIIYGLEQAIPEEISLTNFSYEENFQVIFRGQSTVLNSVWEFASRLEKNPIFSNFNVKVKYASTKKTQQGEIVDFEIVCVKK